MGAHQGTYNPDSHLYSTSRIPFSDPTGLHPRPTGGPFSEGSYLSAGDTVGIFYALPTGRTACGKYAYRLFILII